MHVCAAGWLLTMVNQFTPAGVGDVDTNPSLAFRPVRRREAPPPVLLNPTAKEGHDSMAISITQLQQSVDRAQRYLLDRQSPEGYWVGKLESDISVTAGYVPFMRILGVEVPKRERKVINVLRVAQLPDGGWSSYPGGQGNLNVSIQAYLALKVAGVSSRETSMERARDFILAQGGVDRAHTFTRILLALFGQISWEELPSLPPVLILLPRFLPLNIYEFASWARATIVALIVILAQRPVYQLPRGQGVQELLRKPAEPDPLFSPGQSAWERAFLMMDRLLKVWERVPWKPGRERALRTAERWIVEHQEADGSWGGIMLPWLYSLVALNSLGYGRDHPVIAKGLAGLEGFISESDSSMLLQPAVSPVWDTAYSVIALRESGLAADHPALVKAGRWLMDQQVLTGGDWQVKRPNVEPGAWAFEFENDRYPDVDDSVIVPTALGMVHLAEEEEKTQAIDRAVRWVLSMQSRSGGWAAFDVDNDVEMLAHIPFADFMTPLDPVTVDVTAHVVELLSRLGYSRSHEAMKRGLRYLRDEQEENGAWFGRWGVNYIYGTVAALMALREAGEDMGHESISRATRWLEKHQNEDGGWGESCHSYEDISLQGTGPSTASQTAWAVLGLLSTEANRDAAVVGGIKFLLQTQRSDGGWDEEYFTGTGFPCAFYLGYHMYPIYFPLMALARFASRASRTDD